MQIFPLANIDKPGGLFLSTSLLKKQNLILTIYKAYLVEMKCTVYLYKCFFY